MNYLFFKVRREDIYAIKFILEGFENWITVSTIDETASKIQISIAADFLKECRKIIADLQTQFTMIPVDEEINTSQGNY